LSQLRELSSSLPDPFESVAVPATKSIGNGPLSHAMAGVAAKHIPTNATTNLKVIRALGEQIENLQRANST
jgi:hypothetical protein